jgi:hypothetical protein
MTSTVGFPTVNQSLLSFMSPNLAEEFDTTDNPGSFFQFSSYLTGNSEVDSLLVPAGLPDPLHYRAPLG